jgi:hypothetical protein
MPTTKRLLIQVVSQLKPERCGVSDHALLLARELESAFGTGSAFVVLNSTEPCNVSFPRVYCPPSQLLEGCKSLSSGQPAALLVHYSGYGYSKDGAPFPLAEALENVKKSGQFRIGTYFHELFATGMPWNSAFWYTRRQQKVARMIAKSCDLAATNLSFHSDWLVRNAIQGAGTPLERLAVFSNVGESPEIPPMRARRPAMVVFGLPGTRKKSYRCLRKVGNMMKGLGIEEMIDIGPDCDAPSDLGGIPVNRMGVLAAADLARILSQSVFGFVPHPPFCLAKSGIFAGLCAHGTIPVLAESFPREMDGLTDGVHLVSPSTAKAVLSGGLERCSAAAWNWYSGHKLHAHAATYARLLLQPLPEAGMDVCTAAKVTEE